LQFLEEAGHAFIQRDASLRKIFARFRILALLSAFNAELQLYELANDASLNSFRKIFASGLKVRCFSEINR
jgi:hypothetical protein